MKRVVVTGLGVVSSLGLDAQSTWHAMLGGKTGVGPLWVLDLPGEPVQVAAQVELPPDGPGGRHSSRST